MATAPQPHTSPILPATQLKLPLTNPENSLPISPQEVWEKLDPRQQEALSQQIVNICRGLVRDAEAGKESDE
jgi:hypothetical protein